MEFIPLAELLNTGFTIVEIGLFYGGDTSTGSENVFDKMAKFT